MPWPLPSKLGANSAAEKLEPSCVAPVVEVPYVVVAYVILYNGEYDDQSVSNVTYAMFFIAVFFSPSFNNSTTISPFNQIYTHLYTQPNEYTMLYLYSGTPAMFIVH